MERERHLKNLKKIAALAKNKRNTYTKKLNLGKNLIATMQDMGCYPKNVFYTPENKNSLVSIENSSTLIKKGTKKIGTGAFGEVFMGCIDKECTKKIAIKIVKGYDELMKHEYKMGKRIAQFGGVKPFALRKCDKMTILYTEYANNGNLLDFLKINKDKLLPIHFRTIITQILHNLYRINKKYPTFKHNDLHLENILINTSKPSRVKIIRINNTQFKVHDIGLQTLISDFGLSMVKGTKNPEIDADPAWYQKHSGISQNSHYLYDAHCFLTRMRAVIKGYGIQGGLETISFIERILPMEYLQKDSHKVYDHRLRVSPLGHPDLPTFKQIFNDRYFSPYKKAVVPLDITTIIGKKTPIKPKNIIVKHGGKPIKKTLEQIKKELAYKNNKKVIKRPVIKVRIQPQKPKVSMAKKGYIKINKRKCINYKKQDLVRLAKTLNINTESKTIKKICHELKLKYIK
jgi:hypothetical protein